MWDLGKVFVVLSVFLSIGGANVIKNDVSNSKDVSTRCYYCTGEEEGVDNIANCSIENDLEIEECPLDDLFDKCIVVQAFSRSKNTTIFKRECTSRRYCEERTACSNEDYTDCRYECCSGELCNNFVFANEVGSNTLPPTVAVTTQNYQELVQPENVETDITTERTEQSTVVPEVTTQGSEVDPRQVTTQSFTTTTKKNQVNKIVPVVEEGCEDLDTFCPTYVTDPSHWPMFCKDNDKYTSIACRKTCKFCISSHEVTTTKASTQRPTEIETTSTTETVNLEDCKDQRLDCYELRVLDYCRLMPEYMTAECTRTCEFCPNGRETATKIPVTEKVTTLESVVTELELTAKPTTAKPVNTDFAANSAEQQTTSSTEQRTTGSSGQQMKTTSTQRQTTSRVQTMMITKEQTTKSTNQQATNRVETTSGLTEILTTSSTTSGQVQSGIEVQSTSENENCQDKKDNCDYLKSMDYCRLMTWYMEINCRRTCGLCSNAESIAVSTNQPKPSDKLKNTNLPTANQTTRAEQITSSTEFVRTTIETTPATERETQGTAQQTPEPTSQLEKSTVKPQTTSEPINSTEPNSATKNSMTEKVTTLESVFTELELTTKPTTSRPVNTDFTATSAEQETTSSTGQRTTSSTEQQMRTTSTQYETTSGEQTTKMTTKQRPTRPTTNAEQRITSGVETSSKRREILTSSPTTTDCQDKRDNCDYLKSMDYCRLMTWYMEINCKKTCGLCSDGNVTNTSASVTTGKSIPHSITSPVTSEEITQPSPEPTSVVTSSETSSTTSQLTTAQTSSESNVVPTPKQTTDESTGNVTNTPPSATTGKSIPHSITSPVTSEEITQPSPEPSSFVTSSETSSTTSQLRTAQISSESNVVPTPQQATDESCVDISIQCAVFAKKDAYCDYHHDFMAKNCPKSCGFCSPEGSTSTNQPKPSDEVGTVTATKLPTVNQTTIAEQTTSSTEFLHTTSKATSLATGNKTEETAQSTFVPTSELKIPTVNPRTTSKPATSTEAVNVAGGPMVEATARVDTSSTESMNITTKETPQVTENNTEGTAQPTPEPTSEFETSTVKIQTTSKPVIPNKNCRDKRDECPKYAKYPGYCEYTSKFMLQYCPKSCGFCDGLTTIMSTQRPTRIETTSSTATPDLEGLTTNMSTQRPTRIETTNTTATPDLKDVTMKMSTQRPTRVETTGTTESQTFKGESEYDVVFVIGARNPNAVKSFEQQKKMIENTVKNLTLNDVRYGLVVYTETGQTYLRKDSPLPTPVLINEILKKTSWEREGTRVDKGIKKAIEQFGNNTESQQRIVAFIDAASDASYSEMKEARLEAEKMGIKLVVVGMDSKYDTGELLNLAPKYQNRVFFVGTTLENDTNELGQAATDIVTAITQDDAEKDLTNQGQAGQAGVPATEEVVILGPTDPQTAEFGDKLRWKIWPWSECVNGKQKRAVRCYHFFEEKDYHVIITSCIKYVAPMPPKERDC